MHANPTSDPKTRSRRNLIGWAIHATVFLVVGAWMVVVNLLTSPGVPWFTWSLAGWGIGLAMHTVGMLRFEMLTEEEQRAFLEHEAGRRAAYGGGCCGHHRSRCGHHIPASHG